MLAIDYGYLKDNPPAVESRQGEATSSDDQQGSAGADNVIKRGGVTYSSDGDNTWYGEARRGGTCILFGTEARSDSSLAMVVPGKGNAAEWISKRIAGWIDRLGSLRASVPKRMHVPPRLELALPCWSSLLAGPPC